MLTLFRKGKNNDILNMRTSRVGVFIQARVNSRRLPGKIYEGLPDKDDPAVLEHIYSRLKRVEGVDIIVVLIPESDKELHAWCLEREMVVYSGPEHNVRERFRMAARYFETDIVVRATGDNPCVDPDVARETIRAMRSNDFDLMAFSNLPLGIAVEAFQTGALLSDIIPVGPGHIEHVSLHIKENKKDFRVEHTAYPINYQGVTEGELPRLTVDTPEDICVIRRVFSILGSDFRLPDLISLYRDNPEIFYENKNIKQRSMVPEFLVRG